MLLIGHFQGDFPKLFQIPVIKRCFCLSLRQDDEEFQNPVDSMFENLEKRNPKHFAVRQYKKYKLAAGNATM